MEFRDLVLGPAFLSFLFECTDALLTHHKMISTAHHKGNQRYKIKFEHVHPSPT